MLSGSQHERTLQESINETYRASSAEDAYKITDNMLKTLGKPQAKHELLFPDQLHLCWTPPVLPLHV